MHLWKIWRARLEIAHPGESLRVDIDSTTDNSTRSTKNGQTWHRYINPVILAKNNDTFKILSGWAKEIKLSEWAVIILIVSPPASNHEINAYFCSLIMWLSLALTEITKLMKICHYIDAVSHVRNNILMSIKTCKIKTKIHDLLILKRSPFIQMAILVLLEGNQYFLEMEAVLWLHIIMSKVALCNLVALSRKNSATTVFSLWLIFIVNVNGLKNSLLVSMHFFFYNSDEHLWK